MEPNVEGFGQIHIHICQILTRSKVCTLLVSSAGLTPLISPVSGKLNCVRIRIFFLATLFFHLLSQNGNSSIASFEAEDL